MDVEFASAAIQNSPNSSSQALWTATYGELIPKNSSGPERANVQAVVQQAEHDTGRDHQKNEIKPTPGPANDQEFRKAMLNTWAATNDDLPCSSVPGHARMEEAPREDDIFGQNLQQTSTGEKKRQRKPTRQKKERGEQGVGGGDGGSSRGNSPKVKLRN